VIPTRASRRITIDPRTFIERVDNGLKIPRPSSVGDGERLVFLGDSITQGRLYTTYIEAYLLAHFAEWTLTFRNAGWGSDTAWFDRRTQGTDMR